MTKRYDPRRARVHLSYTRAELSALYKVRITTISRWVRNGLLPIDGQRPFLFAGSVVRQFLEGYNKPYYPTDPGEVYCVACKRVIIPAGSVVDFVPLGPTNGNFCGTCPHCSHQVRQRVRTHDIDRKAGHLVVRYKDAAATFIGDSERPRSEPSGGVSS